MARERLIQNYFARRRKFFFGNLEGVEVCPIEIFGKFEQRRIATFPHRIKNRLNFFRNIRDIAMAEEDVTHDFTSLPERFNTEINSIVRSTVMFS